MIVCYSTFVLLFFGTETRYTVVCKNLVLFWFFQSKRLYSPEDDLLTEKRNVNFNKNNNNTLENFISNIKPKVAKFCSSLLIVF